MNLITQLITKAFNTQEVPEEHLKIREEIAADYVQDFIQTP